MKTKALFVCLTFMLWWAGLPVRAASETIEIDGITYRIYDTSTLATVVGISADAREVVIPSKITWETTTYTVRTIRSSAFDGCVNLESLTFPALWKNISSTDDSYGFLTWCTQKQAFLDGAPNLKTIAVEAGSSGLRVEDNILYYENTLLAYPNGDERRCLTIPAGIESVAPINNPHLESIVFTDSLKHGMYLGDGMNLSDVYVKNKSPEYLGGKFPAVLHVPQGAGRAYFSRFYSDSFDPVAFMTKILEEGNDVPLYFTTVWKYSGSFYDLDEDGLIECLPYDYCHSGASNYLIHAKDKYYGCYGDMDCDGYVDFVTYFTDNKGQDIIEYQQKDGSFLSTSVNIVDTMPKRVKTITGVIPFSVGMFVGGSSTGAPKRPSVPMFIQDVNNDGFCDILNNSSGNAYFSYGKDATFYKNGSDLTLFPCDLTGNGLTDFVGVRENKDAYVQLCQADGSYVEKTLFTNSNLTCDGVFLRDFNHDGLLDILLPFRYGNTIYFIFFKNNGDATFTKREKTVDLTDIGKTSVSECRDIDNDGCYEIVYEFVYVSGGKKVIKVGSDFSITPMPLDYNRSKFDAIIDFNNDGWMEVLYTNQTNHCSFAMEGLAEQKSANTRPKKMGKPTAVYNSDIHRLHITWPKGEDAETSTCDLTYELRIGSAPGLGDFYYGRANADGRRLTLEEGNMGRKNMFLYNTHYMTEGTYYISVQAVDGGGLGGQWSDSFVYEHRLEAPVVTCNIAGYVASSDTLVFRIANYQSEAAYRWELPEDAEVAEQGGDSLRVRFHTAGDHSVRVEESWQGRSLVSEALTFYVNPFSAERMDIHPFYEEWMFDADQDGWLDSWNSNLYQNDGTSFTMVKKSFNTEGTGGSVVLDYNKDGVPDIIGNATSGNLFLNISEVGDIDFEKSSVDIYVKYSETNTEKHTTIPGEIAMDMNNDGLLDFLRGRYSSRGFCASGDALHYVDQGDNITYYDVNRDGFLDKILAKPQSGDNYNIYVAFKKPTADMEYDEEQLMFEGAEKSPEYYADMNNDGYVDAIYTLQEGNVYKHVILPGGPQYPCKKDPVVIETTETSEISGFVDLDNNGFLDLIGRDNKVYYYFYPNFQYEKRYASVSLRDLDMEEWVVFKSDGYPSCYYGNIKNEAPQAPTGVVARQTAEGLLITWNDAVDDKTPAMQMRYNISVKRKGKTGDNSFLISPMNGLKDNVPLPNNRVYPQATRYLVPSTALTDGETYEVQVQALDLWGVQSPMSSVVEVAINGNGYVEVAELATVGESVPVKFVGTQGMTVTLDPGADGTIESQDGYAYQVRWSTPGQKDILFSVNGIQVKSSILVKEKDDVTLAPIPQVYANAAYVYELPAVFADYAGQCTLTCTDTRNVSITWKQGEPVATLLFKNVGTYTLRAASENGVCSNESELVVHVTEVMPEANISRVDCEDGHYALMWNTSEFANCVTDVNVYKETSNTNEFEKLVTLPYAEGRYIDTSSDPRIRSDRYRLTFTCANGQESNPGQAHQPLHVMVAKAAGNGYNLIWNSYKGLNVNNYTILRGTEANQLEEIDRVPGSVTNYTDLAVNEGVDYYYSVRFSPVSSASPLRSLATPVASNVVCTNGAVDFVPMDSLVIVTSGYGIMCLMDRQREMQFYAAISPLNVTLPKVRWWLEGAGDYAEVTDDGLVRALKEGLVETFYLHAEALDGSGCGDVFELGSNITVTEPFSIAFEQEEVKVDEVVTIDLLHSAGWPVAIELDEGGKIDELGDDALKVHWTTAGTKKVKIECRETVCEFTVEVKGNGFHVSYEKSKVEVNEIWTLYWYETDGREVSLEAGEGWELNMVPNDYMVKGYWTKPGMKNVKVECGDKVCEFTIEVCGTEPDPNPDPNPDPDPDPDPVDYTSYLGDLLSDSEWINDQILEGWQNFSTKQVTAPEFVDSEFTGTGFEAWNDASTGIPAGRAIYRTVDGLPNGVYRLTAAVMSRNQAGGGTEDVVFYANDTSTPCYSATATMKYRTLDNVIIYDGTLELGINNLSPSASNWSVIADVHLYFLGSHENQVNAHQRAKLGDALADWRSLVATHSFTSEGLDMAESTLAYAQSVYNQNSSSVGEINNALMLLANTKKKVLLAQLPPADFTFAIQNPAFSVPSKSNFGWLLDRGTVTVNATLPEAEFYDETFDIYQSLGHLPAGTYELTAQGFYRQGLPTSAASLYRNGKEGNYTELYATVADETSIFPFLSIMTGATPSQVSSGDVVTSCGYVPNNMSGAYTRFMRGDYDGNKLTFVVTDEDSDVIVGLRKDRAVSSDWCIFTNWGLTYVSTETQLPPTDMQGRTMLEDGRMEYFTVDGVKVEHPKHGLYICRKVEKDGTVVIRKIMLR